MICTLRLSAWAMLMLLTGTSALSQTPLLVKDIRAGASGSNPEQLTDVNGTLFFVASTGTSGAGTGKELYKSDGTEAGTILVKDIYVAGNSNPEGLTNWNGTLYFSAENATHGRELWKSDGTNAGTVMVKDIRPSTGDSNPANLMVYNNTLYFVAEDGSHGYELWKTDGTEAGTVMVTDLYTGAGDAFRGGSASMAKGNHFEIMGGFLYFSAQGSAATGNELWRTNGTAGGTTLVKDIYPGGNDGNPNHLKNINGLLYFWARLSTGGGSYELWKSDGTADGTVLVKDIYPGGANSSGGWDYNSNTANSTPGFAAMGSQVYFTATEGTTGFELWKTDGIAAGTVQVKDIKPGTGSANIGRGYTFNNGFSGMTLFNGELYFSAENGSATPYHGQELWKTDGTEAGTVMVKDIVAGTGDATPEFFTVYNNKMIFAAGASDNSRTLWMTDGTASNTVSVNGAVNPEYLTISNGRLFFSAESASVATGNELFSLDLSALDSGDMHTPAATLYPNPVKDRLFIGGVAITSAVVYDIQGRQCAVQMRDNSIDMSNLPNGLYLVEIISEGSRVCKKIVKQ